MPAISAGALKRMLDLPANVVTGAPRIEKGRIGGDLAWPAVRPVGRAPVASSRYGLREAPAGIRAAARRLRGPWGDGRDGAVGAEEERVHV